MAYFKSLIEKGYELKPFQFAVISFTDSSPCTLFEMVIDDLLAGKYGGKALKNSYLYQGYYFLLQAYLYHTTTDNWNNTYEYIINNGKYFLNSFV